MENSRCVAVVVLVTAHTRERLRTGVLVRHDQISVGRTDDPFVEMFGFDDDASADFIEDCGLNVP